MKTIFEKSNGVEGIGFGECKLGDYLPQVLLRKEAVGLPRYYRAAAPLGAWGKCCWLHQPGPRQNDL